MSLFDLYPNQEANTTDTMLRTKPQEPVGGETLGSVGSSAFRGVGAGLASLGQPGIDITAGLAANEAQRSGMDPNAVMLAELSSGGTYSPADTSDTTPKEPAMSPEMWAERQRESTKAVVDSFKPDPRTSGWLSNTLFGLSSVGTRAVAGGPALGGLLAGVSEGYDIKKSMQQQGVSDEASDKIGILGGLMTGGMVSAPMAFGDTLLKKVATGVGVNTVLGATDRGLTGKILDDAGYHEMAQQYHILDAQGILTDAVLGAAFGGLAHLHKLTLDRNKPLPSTVDAALASNEQLHAENAGPGIPKDFESRDNNTYNFGQSLDALLNNEPVKDLKEVQTVPDPAKEAGQAEAASTIADAVREATPEAEPSTLGMAEYPFHDMTAQELEAHADNSAALVKQHEDAILGDRADEWRKALRQSNGSNDATAMNGLDTMADIEGQLKLSPQDLATLYGTPGGKLHVDAYDDVKDFREGVSFGTIENADEAVQVMKYQLGKLNNVKGSDPAKWTREQRVAYATASAVNDSILAKGLDSESISNRSIREAAKRYGDPVDAELMLSSFLKPRAPRRKKLQALSPPVFTNERRQTVLDSSRLNELSDKMDSGQDLNAAEMGELIKLQRDKIFQASTQSGMPIRGVLSSEGAKRAMAGKEFKHVTFVDANDFKSVNDTFGHNVGDQVIQHTGETLRRFIPPEAVMEHRSGDEFMIHHDEAGLGSRAVEQANAELAKTKIHAVDDNGNIIKTREGVSLARGTAENKPGSINVEGAEERLQEHKNVLKQEGKRTGARDKPAATPNAERVGEKPAPGGNEAGAGEAAKLDPDTAEAVEAAQKALAENPGLHVEVGDEAGDAKAMLQAALDDVKNGQLEGEIAHVAAACFGRV